MNPDQNQFNQQGQQPETPNQPSNPPQQPVPQAPNAAGGPQGPLPVQQQTPIAQTHDQSDFYANGQKPGNTLGILSIVFCWLPLIAWILGGIAISKGSLNPKLRTLGIIGVVLGTIFFAINLMLFFDS